MRALALGLLALVACDDHPSAPPPASPASAAHHENRSPGCGKAAARGVGLQHVAIGGKSRSYTVVVPPAYAADTPYPLVYVLHGHGGSGAQARTAFDLETTAKGRAIFVYPDGVSGGWDLDTETAKNRDVDLFDATLAYSQSHYCVDLDRVFVTGFSNGAYMANQLACKRGDRIRAIASHSGGGPYEVAGQYDDHGNLVCRSKAVASLVVHGTNDGTVAPAEGQKSIDHWTHANHCGGAGPWTAAPGQGCVAYQGCENPVVACKVSGLGHALAPQARSMIWTFFDTQK